MNRVYQKGGAGMSAVPGKSEHAFQHKTTTRVRSVRLPVSRDGSRTSRGESVLGPNVIRSMTPGGDDQWSGLLVDPKERFRTRERSIL